MTIHPSGVTMRPNAARVLIRSFIPADPARIVNIIGRALALSEAEIEEQLVAVTEDFGSRHLNLRDFWRRHFGQVKAHIFSGRPLSEARQLYIGALFSGEYALEAAALFNPSVVPHPDQAGLAEGELRFIMSLRATGEGHISSIEFRTGIIHADHTITMEDPSRFVTAPKLNPNPTFRKMMFVHKLMEMGFENDWSATVMESLGFDFTLSELEQAMRLAARGLGPLPREVQRTTECVRWLAQSNYEVHFDPSVAVSERIIFPVSSNESNGMEDARFVRFVEDDDSILYYATYTAYNGRAILPQLLETSDFLSFRARTLNGSAVQNKGMAFFPRRIDGRYVMLSRQDDENQFIMFSENPHFWGDPQLLRRPSQPWEAVKIGNCGSPVETKAGWLVITHGVGPMRKYSIGALLLDLRDPTKVLAELREPLLQAVGSEREGYVPNVVYTCGALLHRDRLILPYALCDTATTIVTIPLDELLAAMTPCA
ncbi:MAG: glycoside hydrolase family 130 protein [Chthoniobacter sp.]|uniref:glycoside hydrolase family 130 protein n=1 Tax=Chthoniobacter sp. TaxID=2510640 RepID=UPI0032ADD67A